MVLRLRWFFIILFYLFSQAAVELPSRVYGHYEEMRFCKSCSGKRGGKIDEPTATLLTNPRVLWARPIAAIHDPYMQYFTVPCLAF